MKKSFLLTFSICLFTSVFAQIDFKGELNKAKEDALKKAKEVGENKMDDSRKEFDESNFNYAISFSDNAGLFETKEKSDRVKNALIEGYKVTTDHDADLTVDRAKNFNNSGEIAFASNKFHSAEFSFKQ